MTEESRKILIDSLTRLSAKAEKSGITSNWYLMALQKLQDNSELSANLRRKLRTLALVHVSALSKAIIPAYKQRINDSELVVDKERYETYLKSAEDSTQAWRKAAKELAR